MPWWGVVLITLGSVVAAVYATVIGIAYYVMRNWH